MYAGFRIFSCQGSCERERPFTNKDKRGVKIKPVSGSNEKKIKKVESFVGMTKNDTVKLCNITSHLSLKENKNDL